MVQREMQVIGLRLVVILWGLFSMGGVASHGDHTFSKIAVHETVSAIDDAVFVKASPLVLGLKGQTSEWLTITLHNPKPSIDDWIGVFSPANFSASTCLPDSSMVSPPLLCTAPIKFQYANYSSPSYKDTGKATLKFQLINQRSDFSFALFSGGLSKPKLVAVSNSVVFASPNAPNPLLRRQFLSVKSVAPQGTWHVGSILNNTASSEESTGKGKKKVNSFELILIIVPSTIVVILVALLIVYLYIRKRKPTPVAAATGIALRPLPPATVSPRRNDQQIPVVVFKEIGVRLTLDTVVQATGNFTLRNCIGSGGFGSTYRAEISPGTTVAVKRLTVEMCQGVPQFNNEIRSLGRIRHPNLVTLIGYYASSTERFLIYNFLAGGNLEKFILDRPIRAIGIKILHKIAFGVANALHFLHDLCKPRILHRDVKPSNILLDENFNAYLSDFGLARLLDDFETHVTTGVAGTFGYVAPEYALTCRASEKADVYSYGVMLLELISDKRALDSSFSNQENGYTIVSWAGMLRREGRPQEVFTAGLWDAGPEDVLLELLHLGLLCTADSVSGRPTMKQVVRKLTQIQPEA